MSKTINGVTISVNFCNKINAEAIPASQVSKNAPIANITKNDDPNNPDSYVVNIIGHVPTSLNPDNPKNPDEVVSLDNGEGYLNLAYKGLEMVKTPINEGKTEINCRNFWFEFNASKDTKKYDLYHTQFVYSTSKIAKNAEAILVQQRNDDPETDRGTVTTVRTGDY